MMNTQSNFSEAAPLEAAEMRCMSVFVEGDKIAFACYIEEKNEILLEQSHANGHDTEAVAELFLGVARPNLLLCSKKIAMNLELLQILTRPSNVQLSNEDTFMSTECDVVRTETPQNRSNSIPFKILKSGAFDLKSCRLILLQKLRVLSLLRQNQEHREQSVLAYHRSRPEIFLDHNAGHSVENCTATTNIAYNSLAALIDFESSTLIRALGSLVTYLQDTTFRMEDGCTITVNSITYAKSTSFMRIDASTLHSLHIFSTEHHPLIAKGIGNSKEGFSLFTLLDRCKSKIGRQCLREWMLKPVLDPLEISRRQDGIELFLCPEMQSLAGVLLNLLQQVGAIDKILLRIQKCHSLPIDFLILSEALRSAMAICNILSHDLKLQISSTYRDSFQASASHLNPKKDSFGPRSIAFLDSILERCFIPVLQGLYERITSVVDEEMTSHVRDAVIIHSGFNEELDKAKLAFESLSETLSAVGAEVLDKYPELQQIKVVFLPQVGFLIKLRRMNHANNKSSNELITLPESFSLVFTQNDDMYYKNEDMRQLDEDVGDLESFIRDTEDLIKTELEDDILFCESELRSTFCALAELDCILSLTSCAADLDFSRPEVVMGDTPIIFIENGRHPLQELIIEGEFIKNSTLIDQNSRINIVTGSNFSGKSCYLRQVGVLVYMAHIGSFIPCTRAKFSITDQILARISSVETCSVPQSSFQLDLTQMAVILRKSTPKSLVLIDEFGKGTAPASGVAVLSAAIHKLSNIGCKVICTTHFLEIFSMKLIQDGKAGVSAQQMAVHMSEGDNFPLFLLEKGIATASAGLTCARIAGVQNSVLIRVKEILDATKEGRPVPPIPDKLNSNSAFHSRAKSAIHAFILVKEWMGSSEKDLIFLDEKVASM